MNLAETLKAYDDKLLARISFLEKRVEDLSQEREPEFKYARLIDLVMNRIITPEGLEFHDGIIQRNFQDDLRTLFIQTLTGRTKAGMNYYDFDGHLCRYFPSEADVHMHLDKQADFPNIGDWHIHTLEDMHAYVEKRKVWVRALLSELKTIL